jgi:hypothetical protein
MSNILDLPIMRPFELFCSTAPPLPRANALKFLGKQHLTAEIIIPGGLQALLLETEVGRLLLKQIHAQVSDCRHDGGCVALADAAFIFSKHPV